MPHDEDHSLSLTWLRTRHRARTRNQPTRINVSIPVTKLGATTDCNAIRTTAFIARLDLDYYYLVETDGQNDLVPDQLSGLEEAIRYAVVGALNMCDSQDQPYYAILLESAHHISTDGKDDD